MRRFVLALLPVNLLHELGTGRALDNACRERAEVARTMAVVDALAARLEQRPAAAVGEPAGEERVAA